MCEKWNRGGPITESPDESFLVVRIRDVLLLDGLLHVGDRDFEGNSLVEIAKNWILSSANWRIPNSHLACEVGSDVLVVLRPDHDVHVSPGEARVLHGDVGGDWGPVVLDACMYAEMKS